MYGDNRFPLRLDDYETVINGASNAAEADLSPFADPREIARLLAGQHFRLVYWREAGERINWRRFFDITSLAALRVEDDAVFEQTHATIFRLFSEGLIDGVRVDHVDGLADPAAYCRRLRARLEALGSQRPETLPREPAIVLVEKILAENERLPADWRADGTTGYDFMNAVSEFQHDAAGGAPLTDVWVSVSGRAPDFESEERQARGEMLTTAFTSALRTTALAFASLRSSNDVTAEDAERAVALLIERFRAYRTYAVGDSDVPPPGEIFERAWQSACDDSEADVQRALDLVAAVVRGEWAEYGPGVRDAVRRFNQLAAPVAAKAVEDTAFYRYGRLLSRNDVGFSPGRLAATALAFHEQNERRAAEYPGGLLATATHDDKRGEDTRSRLAVLSEIPELWTVEQCEWFAMNGPLRPAEVGAGDEYQLYQTLLGAWPNGLSVADAGGLAAFTDRILAWREKSLREAKLGTSWAEPNELLESAHRTFVRRILDPAHGFAARLARFAERIAPAGAVNSLVASALRCTCPGVPDLYQGSELWDLSLVDPDNRRPVDFTVRRAILARDELPSKLMACWRDGEVKLAMIHRLLSLRSRLPHVFAAGNYVRLSTRSDQVFAFAREFGETIVMVAVPRLCARDAIERGVPLPRSGFARAGDVDLPAEWRRRRWLDVLDSHEKTTMLDDETPLFTDLPVSVLVSER